LLPVARQKKRRRRRGKADAGSGVIQQKEKGDRKTVGRPGRDGFRQCTEKKQVKRKRETSQEVKARGRVMGKV
jgi:hypothetical protein